MMNRYNETGTIINFSARTYMNHKWGAVKISE